jgi:hypothetical protein
MSPTRIEELARFLQRIPLIAWVLMGFILAYLVVFVTPVFLSAGSMQFFEPAPAAEHLGIDLKMRLSWSAYWLDPSGLVPDGNGTVFPPFANLLFSPLLTLRFSTAYALLTFSTVLLYVVLILVLPLLMSAERRLSPVAVLICATGPISYGLQFELERGQWNVITLSLVLVAVWLFHRHQRLRPLAYVLFLIAVQLKLYPIVFLPLLVSDWRRWRENVARFLLLSVTTVLLFFVQGIRPLQTWISGLRDWSAEAWIWEGNPSIQSAVTQAAEFATRQGWTGLASSAGVIQKLLSLVVVLCLIAILVRVYRTQRGGLSAHYLLAAAIGCLLVPSGGYDYRLSILGAPLVMVFLVEEAQQAAWSRSPAAMLRSLAFLVLSFVYATTLVPYGQKPFYLANNFPALFVMLLLVTLLALTSQKQTPQHAPGAQNPGPSLA